MCVRACLVVWSVGGIRVWAKEAQKRDPCGDRIAQMMRRCCGDWVDDGQGESSLRVHCECVTVNMLRETDGTCGTTLNGYSTHTRGPDSGSCGPDQATCRRRSAQARDWVRSVENYRFAFGAQTTIVLRHLAALRPST
eukprot:2261766-Prymnesium_polylepis.1